MLLRHTCGLSLNAAVNVSDEYIYKKKKQQLSMVFVFCQLHKGHIAEHAMDFIFITAFCIFYDPLHHSGSLVYKTILYFIFHSIFTCIIGHMRITSHCK